MEGLDRHGQPLGDAAIARHATRRHLCIHVDRSRIDLSHDVGENLDRITAADRQPSSEFVDEATEVVEEQITPTRAGGGEQPVIKHEQCHDTVM